MEKVITIAQEGNLQDIFGIQDRNVKLLEKEFDVTISLAPEGICVRGQKERVDKATRFVNRVVELGSSGFPVDESSLQEYLARQGTSVRNTGVGGGNVSPRILLGKRKEVIPKTPGQGAYLKAIGSSDLVFAIGPAGTGKTYLAMAMAVAYLMAKKVSRIILTRPALDAGESLGFLPGDIYAKLGPYLRPLYDALYDMLDADDIQRHIENGVIEVVPFAYMRGRTLNNAFVILDEAQNCTSEQLKMFLTRLGCRSKAVITGDVTQSDLPGGQPIGLLEAGKILKAISEIQFVRLTKNDIVRHPLVRQIIQAYEDFIRNQGKE